MNHIAFATKRAFHGILRVSRKLLASLGLTAARFDLLFALLDHRPSLGGWRTCEHAPLQPRSGRRQSWLRKLLGVTPGVVSRMLGALEKLGWVTREVDPFDGRQRLVRLTTNGSTGMARARHPVLRSVQRLVGEAICFGRTRSRTRRFLAMSTLDSYLHALRSEFGDTATLYYAWGHPDD
jgi:DNA-binding MarR family transcriptional regulator